MKLGVSRKPGAIQNSEPLGFQSLPMTRQQRVARGVHHPVPMRGNRKPRLKTGAYSLWRLSSRVIEVDQACPIQVQPALGSLQYGLSCFPGFQVR